jgi:hypothetical protein
MPNLQTIFRSGLDLVLGEESREAPPLPDALPAKVVPIARQAVAKLTGYQNAEYAELYLSRLQRFTRRRGVGTDLLVEIARLLAERMSYSDPIWIAQLRLAQVLQGQVLQDGGRGEDGREAIHFPLSDIVSLLPGALAEGASAALVALGREDLHMPMRFTARTRAGLLKLKAIALLRRMRLSSARYPKERALVERWLHMIDRSLTKCPEAALEIARTASIIEGSGDVYHRSVALWNVVIDRLVKPVFDGVINVPDLHSAVAEARDAAENGADRERLRQIIEEIKTRTAATDRLSA